MSLNFTGIEIDTLNSLESWAGGFLVAVSGSVESRDFSGSRKFVQTFFLAPQKAGYFVLNDVFHFSDKRSVHQLSLALENEHLATTSNHLDDLPGTVCLTLGYFLFVLIETFTLEFDATL